MKRRQPSTPVPDAPEPTPSRPPTGRRGVAIISLLVFCAALAFFAVYHNQVLGHSFASIFHFQHSGPLTKPATMSKAPHVIVVGGGLAGMSAACRAVSQGAFVTVIEKEVLGGNSAKATSGINGVHTKFQNELIKQGLVVDSVELFVQDTMKAGHMKNKPELVEVLSRLSGPAVDSLDDEFGLTLSDVNQLGGHSAKRTHRFPAKDGRVLPVGFTMVNTIKKKYLEYVEAGKAALMQKTQLVDVEIEDSVVTKAMIKNTATGEVQTLTNFTALILAAGGYAADSTSDSILAQNRPDLIGYPTTNGDFASGDVIRIGQKRGLATIHLNEVQLHPTGFVDPKDPHANRKFLCPEVMRGVGAIMVNTSGHRFVDELKPRDKVSQAIVKDGGSVKAFGLSDREDTQRMGLMLMTQTIAEKFGMAAFKFYMQKGFIFDLSDGASLKAHAPTIDMSVLQQTLDQYNQACDGRIDDAFGKTVFPEKFNLKEGDALYGCYVTPSLHFSMGGLEIDTKARIIQLESRQPVLNLYAAGESSGGVHGGNRLGGNGCLESVVFGRLAGEEAANA
eukprot:Blabericola_migrator_1__10573@NODE_5_length_29060_cov_171_088642_g4_i0_p5_GENE_NODE_5_length_29060_cov_171_088642_g4_i0NODE_5_length_29060_cov_171_088642_g4_i0_p5_ORF_typecomplete_len562_score103_85FAD_binding_2/PF00890_24/5_2e80DAO/PF01266_24/2_3e11FAD_oxidored/PF12831_7/5_6e09HI0933_like/PF03486_14/9_9e06HI0933_like/PF03486_14/5_7Pyr_redox_2/PF07992_14/1_6e06NAD_binding_8/PF13450_6/2e06NAD_binding_8/PF13450_6/2_9e03Pyr_redox/PF00070_27/2_4e05Thi4/PF01946_17/0_00018GIDA/PF01134_22/0_00018GIDA/P